MRLRLGALLFVTSLLLAAPAEAAKLVTEVIPLGYRTLDEIVPILRALVPPPGTVTGMQNQLVVRTTADNLDEIKQVLARLDHPPRRLMISVRHERRENLRLYGADVSGRLSAGDLTVGTGRPPATGRGLVVTGRGDRDQRAALRVYQNQAAREGTEVQRIQALEGREAWIAAGQAVPFAERSVILSGRGATVQDSVRYQDVTSGFYALPRLNGDRVTLEIRPRSARLSRRGGGIIDVQSADTVVSGRLGEWLTVGGSGAQLAGHGSGSVYSTHEAGDSDRVILLKVEELP